MEIFNKNETNIFYFKNNEIKITMINDLLMFDSEDILKSVELLSNNSEISNIMKLLNNKIYYDEIELCKTLSFLNYNYNIKELEEFINFIILIIKKHIKKKNKLSKKRFKFF